MGGRLPPPDELAARLAVYLVADPEQTARDLAEDVAAALDGGVTCVQLRAKRLDGGAAWQVAVRLRGMCRPRGVLFIVNDRVDVAVAAQADGVHLGETDLPIVAARKVAGDDFIYGFSPGSLDRAGRARRMGAHYVGIGPVFATGSKADAGDPIGLDELASRIAAAGLPAVGIGGISVANAADVVRAGADGIAVVGAILHADDPGAATAALVQAVRGARGGDEAARDHGRHR